MAMRTMLMRSRPASFTAAAPPSSCQATHSVKPIDATAASRQAAPMSSSLVESEGLPCMAAL